MRRSTGLKALLLASAVAAIGVAAGPAFAADDAAGASARRADTTVEGLVVTARRRQERVFDVAAPVTALSAQTIQTFGIEDMKSVMNQVPNAVLPQSPDNYVTYINIRGIQQTDVQAQPNFGVYRNGVYAGGERPNFGSMVDVDRVEVLAGPQAGLYGRDSVGGAINVVYATPSQSLGGYFSADYGRYDRFDVQGAVNVPVNDKFAARLAGWYIDQSRGEVYNGLLNTYIDKARHDGFRLSAKADPLANLSVTWIAEYDDNRGPSVLAYAPRGITNLLSRSPAEGPDLEYRNTPDINWNNQFYISQDAKYKTGFGTFQWLTNYSDYRMHDIEDADKTGFDPATSLASSTVLQRHEKVRNFYTEVLYTSPDIGPLSFTGGASYFDQKFNFGRTYTSSINLSFLAPYSALACYAYLGDPSCPGIPGGAFPASGGVQSASFAAPDGGSTIDTQSVSIFGQGVLHVTKDLSITGAVRFTDDWEDLNFHQFPIAGGSPYIIGLFANTFPAITLVNGYHYTNVSPSVEVNYRPTSNINLYALYSTGFRAGGFNTSTTSANLIPYGSETADNYEAGIKTLWFDGRLGLNLDGFVMQQHHLLEYQPDPIAPPQFFFYYLNNVGSAQTSGIEFQAQAKLASWWNASASLGWEDGKITGGSSYGYALAGSQLELTRTWTFNLESDAKYPIGGGINLLAGVNFHYESGGYLDITTLRWPDYRRLDATLGVGYGRESLVLYINNALNSRPPQFVYGNGATSLVEGQTYGVRFAYRY